MADGAGDFYDWPKTMSYGADVTMVVAPRGRGKTFGLRRQLLSRAVKTGGPRFAEVCRFKAELPGVMEGYFARLADLPEFAEYEFRAEGREGSFRRQGTDEAWQVCCYFVALSEAQNLKKRTYRAVAGIIFDEALLQPGMGWVRYLPREPEVLANVVDTLTRQIPGVPAPRPHLYLLANAVDLVNPYFAAWGIDRVPPFGYSWHAGHVVLLHYEEPGMFTRLRAEETLAGRMLRGTDEAATAFGNDFAVTGTDTVEERPASARFLYGIAYAGRTFGVWPDRLEGLVYVDRKVPAGGLVYALTRADGTVDRVQARRSNRALKSLASAHYDGVLRYDSPATRELLLDALQLFGVR